MTTNSDRGDIEQLAYGELLNDNQGADPHRSCGCRACCQPGPDRAVLGDRQRDSEARAHGGVGAKVIERLLICAASFPEMTGSAARTTT